MLADFPANLVACATIGVKAGTGPFVRDQFNAHHESLLSDLTHMRMLAEIFQHGGKFRAGFLHVTQEVVLLEQLQARQRRRAGERVAGVGVPVKERFPFRHLA